MSSTPSSRDEKIESARVQKREYVRPTLKRYGDLTQLTKAKGRTGPNSDAALANNNKTR